MNYKSLLNRYAISAALYGFVRGIPKLKDAKTGMYVYDKEKNKTEYTEMNLLYTQKAAGMVLSAGMSVYLLPFFVYQDIKDIEMYIRGIKNEHPYRNHSILDCIMS